MKENNLLDVKIFWSPTTKQETFKGKAKAISGKNRLGNFDILPGHTNFISLIFEELKVYTPEKEISFKFNRGVLETSENQVKIFLGL